MKVSITHKLMFIGPAIVYLAAISVFPLLYALDVSLTDLNLTRADTGSFIGLGNYLQLLSGDSLFVRSVINTLVLIMVVVSVELVFGFAAAKIFFETRQYQISEILRTIFIIPVMLTPLIYGLIWLYILNPTQGVANFLLETGGIGAFTWLGSPKTALMSIGMIDVWQFTPLVTMILLAGLLSIDSELFEAAEVDGARWYHKIRYIELPSITKLVGLAIILRLMDLMRTFDIVYATTRGGPGGSTEVMSMFSYRQAFIYYNIGRGTASAIVALIITIVLSLVFVNLTSGPGEE